MPAERFPKPNWPASSPPSPPRRGPDIRYAYSLHEWAVLALVASDNSERRELLDACEALTRSPGQRSTEQVIDQAGRTNEVIYTAHFRVTYWTDHAAKEVRIIDVRRF